MKTGHHFFLMLLSILMLSCSYLDMENNMGNQTSEGNNEDVPPTLQKTDGIYYYFFDEKIYLKERKDLVLVKFTDKIHKDNYISEIRCISSLKLWTPERKGFSNETNIHNIVVLESVDGDFGQEQKMELDKIDGAQSVSFLTEYNGKLSGTIGEFFVKPHASFSESSLNELANTYGCDVIKKNYYGKNVFVVRGKTAGIDVVQLARIFYETGDFEFTSPNFCHFDILMSSNYYSNTYYYDQWGLKNTGQYGNYNGIDINIEPAWEITQGSDGIIVAVLDSGVDWNHPDLAANMVSGYDVYWSPNPGGPLYQGDYHGTAVAGVIGAVNNSIGLIGVAPECKLMTVRVLDQDYTDNSFLIDGINWAVDHGADILNCSWGDIEPCSLLNSTINDAANLGRNGKGCVFVFSSGNDDGPVSYPATLNNVLAVGAISYQGVRKQASSSSDWGSNYGSQLDVMAPGDRIPTTDLLGIYGFNSSVIPDYPILIAEYNDQNYTRWFDQTSSAAPHAAGVAALILSQYPDLSQSQVRRSIELSCSKISGYTYSSDGKYPSGTRNNEVGYGLINAYGALLQASDAHQTNLIDATSGIDFTITNNSSYDLSDIYVELSGYIGGAYVSLISQDPGNVSSGNEIGYPLYRGETINATAGTTITNISLDFYASTPGYYGNLRVGVAIDNAYPSSYQTNYYGFGTSYLFALPNTTVPNASRRRLYIDIRNP